MWRENVFTTPQAQKFDAGTDQKCRRVDILSYDPPVCNNWVDTVGGDTISASESFVDLAEPFFDADDDDTRNLPTELFFDSNADSMWNNGHNKWDSNTNIFKETIMAWSDASNLVAPSYPSAGQCSGVNPVTPGINLICPNTPFTMGNGDVKQFNFKVCDIHFVNQPGAVVKFSAPDALSDELPPPPVISGKSEFIVPEKQPYKLVYTYSSPTQVTVCQIDPKDSNYRICYTNNVMKQNKTLHLQSDYCYTDTVSLQVPYSPDWVGANVQAYLKGEMVDKDGNNKLLWYITGTVNY